MRASDTQRANVATWVELWRPRLMLHGYKVEYAFHAKAHSADDDSVTHAESFCGFAGLDVELHFYPSFWRSAEVMQEKIVLHELAHVIVPSATEGEINVLTEILWSAYGR